jgi:hypothetical protein
MEMHVLKQPGKEALDVDTELPEAPREPPESPPQRHNCELSEDPRSEEEPDGYGHGV